jgi:hypothetical protein
MDKVAAKEVKERYFDPSQPGSLSGVDKFSKHMPKYSKKHISKILKSEPAYTLHFPVRHRFRRNKVIVASRNDLWDADLLSMMSYKQYNDNYAYILVTVDILSHHGRVRKLKTKSGREVAREFGELLDQCKEAEGVYPRQIRTDKGGEFVSSLTRTQLRNRGVGYYVTQNSQTKAGYAERLNKTLRLSIARYLTKNKTFRWIDILDDVIEAYNASYHRTIKMRPNDVTPGEKEHTAWVNQYEATPDWKPEGEYKFNVGQTVRISFVAKVFAREYDARYTGEVFRVTSRTVRAGLNIYKVADLGGEVLIGTFYQSELLAVTIDERGVFNILKVIRTKKVKGRKKFLVRWEHYPPSFDSWVDEHDFTEAV